MVPRRRAGVPRRCVGAQVIVGAFAPTVRVAAVPAPDETPVVAAPLAGTGARGRSCSRPGRPGEAVLPAQPGRARGRARPPARAPPPHPRARRATAGGRCPAACPRRPERSRSSSPRARRATPKGVELTRAGMEVMGRGYSAGLDAGPSDRWLACLPLHHVASLGVLAARVRHRRSVDGARRLRPRPRGARAARRRRDDRVGGPHRAAPPARRGRADRTSTAG